MHVRLASVRLARRLGHGIAIHIIQTLLVPGYSAFLVDQTYAVKQSTPIFVRIRAQLWRQCCASFDFKKQGEKPDYSEFDL